MDVSEIFKVPIAHRGLHNLSNGIEENSKTAFARAIQGGYAIECDLQLSGDAVPMVLHDETLDRLTEQTGHVSTLSAGQLCRIPLTNSKQDDTPVRFDELLKQVDGAVPLVVEIKIQTDGRNEQLAKATVDMCREYQGPITLKSFSPEIIALVRRANFQGPIGIVVDRLTSDKAKRFMTPGQRIWRRHLLHYPTSKFDYISCGHKDLRMTMVKLFGKAH